MSTYTLAPVPGQVFLDSIGAIMPGGTIQTNDSGTGLPSPTYTAQDGNTPNTNPIVLDGFGRPPADIFIPPGITQTWIVRNAAGVTQRTYPAVAAVPPSNVNLDITGTAGENIAAGAVAYLSDGSGALQAGQWYNASSSNTYSSNTALYVGMAIAAISSGASGSFRIAGRMTGLSGLVVGTRYYIAAAAGTLTSSAPTNSRFVGAADSTTSLVVAPNPAQLGFATYTIGDLLYADTTTTLQKTGANFRFDGTNITIAQDLIFSADKVLRRSTNDGSDNGSLFLAGGGGALQTRGAIIELFGNEHASTGKLQLYVGNVANSALEAYRADGSVMLSQLGADGSLTLTSSLAAAWTLNGTPANGSYLALQRSAIRKGGFGISQGSPAPHGAGTDNVTLWAEATLYLEGTTDVRSVTAYNTTTATAANMTVDSAGIIYRSTSSARYKTAIEPMADADWRWLLDIAPVTFADRKHPAGPRFGGLLAEDVAKAAPMFVVFDPQGYPDEVAYPHLTAPIIKAIQSLAARLTALDGKAA